MQKERTLIEVDLEALKDLFNAVIEYKLHYAYDTMPESLAIISKAIAISFLMPDKQPPAKAAAPQFEPDAPDFVNEPQL